MCMIQQCPQCGSRDMSKYTKSVEGGSQTFESCGYCRFRTATDSHVEGHPRDNVKGDLRDIRRRRRERRGY